MEALREAAREAGSTSVEDFAIQFNVDILAPGVRHGDSEVCVLCNTPYISLLDSWSVGGHDFQIFNSLNYVPSV